MVHSYFAIGQSSKEETQQVFEAEDWRAVSVHQHQQALNICVHAAVHMDTGQTMRDITVVSQIPLESWLNKAWLD